MNLDPMQRDLLNRYEKAVAETKKKLDLVRAAALKGPKAIEAASDTAAKAARRRDVLAAQLARLGVEVNPAGI